MNLPVLPFCMGCPEEMLSFARHTNLCIHNSESYMFLWVVPLPLYSDLRLSIHSEEYVCIRVRRCLVFLWFVKLFYFRMARRNKLQYLIHIQDWVKAVVFRRSNTNPPFVLFYPGVLPPSCQDCHENCTLSHEFLTQWYFLPSFFIPRSRVVATGMPTSEPWCVKSILLATPVLGS